MIPHLLIDSSSCEGSKLLCRFQSSRQASPTVQNAKCQSKLPCPAIGAWGACSSLCGLLKTFMQSSDGETSLQSSSLCITSFNQCKFEQIGRRERRSPRHQRGGWSSRSTHQSTLRGYPTTAPWRRYVARMRVHGCLYGSCSYRILQTAALRCTQSRTISLLSQKWR